ncbi:CLUMA_CG005940, isoform A [Clunio marinus]|uniref:CLUMA_CG005940, isoform A n=1 Tax=Clunio marinus TaxID=568069 RepID=A0A1J1HYD9_9DIPT|nr:CLUMA_CG005940, isoform A [Clunio marinus]
MTPIAMKILWILVLHENDGRLLLRNEDGSDLVQLASQVRKQDKKVWNELKPVGEMTGENSKQTEVNQKPQRIRVKPTRLNEYQFIGVFSQGSDSVLTLIASLTIGFLILSFTGIETVYA